MNTRLNFTFRQAGSAAARSKPLLSATSSCSMDKRTQYGYMTSVLGTTWVYKLHKIEDQNTLFDEIREYNPDTSAVTASLLSSCL